MAIIDDYAGIAAELRRIRAAEKPAPAADPKLKVGAYITARRAIQMGIIPGQAGQILRRSPVLARRGWSTD